MTCWSFPSAPKDSKKNLSTNAHQFYVQRRTCIYDKKAVESCSAVKSLISQKHAAIV